MKRIIKFRAWLNNKKEMFYQNDQYLQSFLRRAVYFSSADHKEHEKYGDYELMQFTGLHDKNGKEIYEGDILEMEWKFTYQVKFEDAQFSCFHVNTHAMKGDKWGALHRMFDLDFTKYHIGVIGNIYENPDLLK